MGSHCITTPGAASPAAALVSAGCGGAEARVRGEEYLWNWMPLLIGEGLHL
jgi:hypothetical protein